MALILLEDRGFLPLPANLQDEISGWVPNSSPQLTAIECRAQLLLYGGASGGGKGLWTDTPIPTPQGFTRMGDLRVGDQVFGADGRPCQVTRVSTVHFRDCFEFRFDDGSMLIADDQHLWKTFSYQERRSADRRTDEWRTKRRAARVSRAKSSPKNRGSQLNVTRMNRDRIYEYPAAPDGGIRTTIEILDTLLHRGHHLNHCVTIAKPLELPTVDLPIDPYTLGVWLGDGWSIADKVGMLSDDLDEVMEKIPYAPIWMREEKGPTYKHKFDVVKLGIQSKLRALGVINNKHIPQSFIRASRWQREELLRGLLDTDGHADKRGQIELGFSNSKLASDTAELLWSLGIKATIQIKKTTGKDSHRFKFVAPFPAFHLKRKLERQKLSGFRDTTRRRYITAVIPTLCVPTRCIEVDSIDSLYLCGKQMIPTHNSNWLVADSAQEYQNPRFRGILLRKSYTEMTNLMDEMERIYLPLGGRKSDGGKLWRFPSGAMMRLGYMAKDADVELYTGKPISWLGIDEAQFQTEDRVRSLLPWVSTPTEYGLRDRVRITANPSTPWLKRVFLNDECPLCHPERSVKPCAVYAGARWKKDDGPVMLTTAFIPAKLEDNPAYDERKLAMLMSQTADIQKKLIRGCWCATEGAFFPFLNESYIYPYSDCGEQWWMTHFISMDYGYSGSAAATGLYMMHENGRIYKIGEDVERKMKSEEYAHHIGRKFIQRIGPGGERCRIVSGYADPAMDAHTGTGQSNLDIINAVLVNYGVTLLKAAKDSIGNAQLLSGKLSRGEVILTDLCPKTYESLSSRKNDPDRPGAILKVAGDELDDVLDETLYGINQFLTGDRKPDQVATEEKIQALVQAGVDQRSIAVTRFRLEREAAKAAGPIQMGRPTINRAGIKR